MKKMKTITRLTAILLMLPLTSAWAELNDPPYFNLWSGVGKNGELGNLASPNDELRLCGTNSCTADNTTADWAIFRTVPANYGKGIGSDRPVSALSAQRIPARQQYLGSCFQYGFP